MIRPRNYESKGQIMRSDADKYDYSVAGAGWDGCILAIRLSINPTKQVLLLEAGGRDWYPCIHVPVDYFETLYNPITDWNYKIVPVSILNGRAIERQCGKTPGGSSSINGFRNVRGQSEDYDYWRQLGNTGWSCDDVLPYFIRSEDKQAVVDSLKFTGQLVDTTALKPYIAGEHLPGSEIETDAELLDSAHTIYGPTSTCKIGSDPVSLVDERLRVHGNGGLRVVNALVIPAIVSGNTNAPTIMIAEDARDHTTVASACSDHVSLDNISSKLIFQGAPNEIHLASTAY